MPNTIKSNKKRQEPKNTGRFATLEEAVQAKNADLIAHIKKLGITAEKLRSDSKPTPSS